MRITLEEFIPIALVALPIVFVPIVIFLAMSFPVPRKIAAVLLAIPIAVAAILYVQVLGQPWYAALGIFLLVVVATEYALFKAIKYGEEMGKPSAQFDLISDRIKKK